MHAHRWNIALSLFFSAFGGLCLIWWIPTDIETGLIEQDRYSVQIGDAMLPTMTALAILGLSFVLALQSFVQLRRGSPERSNTPKDRTALSAENAFNLLSMSLILVTAVVLMVWAGPLSVELLNAIGVTDKSYRQLSDTVPYKYVGFASGGLVMVFGLITWVQGHVHWPAVAVAAGMVVFLILLYDLPFDSLLLPPNGSL